MGILAHLIRRDRKLTFQTRENMAGFPLLAAIWRYTVYVRYLTEASWKRSM